MFHHRRSSLLNMFHTLIDNGTFSDVQNVLFPLNTRLNKVVSCQQSNVKLNFSVKNKISLKNLVILNNLTLSLHFILI